MKYSNGVESKIQVKNDFDRIYMINRI